ncbi:hypothetical protein [Paenisporosarcina sp. TG20]|uniref:hypothetical protein n=1 Tax=Paenisporosarcina sp. TG20 TaxID=1211706 RepID=UPI0002F7C062|nr:hypothetical protein [Paenisporosarcina sp. TG20]
MIKEVLFAYHNETIKFDNHRFKSWEHCYKFFKENHKDLDKPKVVEHACLHLAFYLASWGMLRNSFLLQRDYLIHKEFIENVVKKEKYRFMFDGTVLNFNNQQDQEILNQLISDTRAVYQPLMHEAKEEESTHLEITDTLTSKILLGVYGVVPAYDRYFREAARLHGVSGQFNQRSFNQLQTFYDQHQEEFSSFIEETSTDDLTYTPMKTIDMYFWKVAEILSVKKDIPMIERLINFSSEFRVKDSVRPLTIKNASSSSNKTEDIRTVITEILLAEKASGEKTGDICARDIHLAMNLKNSYPSVCGAMSSLKLFSYEVIHAPPSGKSSTVTYRYDLT